MPTFPVILDYYKEMNDIYIYICCSEYIFGLTDGSP